MVVTGGSPRGRKRRALGFTLIELLTVMAIIAVLAGIVIGVGRRASETGRIARAKAELAAITTALEAFKRQNGDYPRTADPRLLLQALVGRLDANLNSLSTSGRVLLDLALFQFEGAGDPLVSMDARLLDPWGRPYDYSYKAPASGWRNPSFVLYSRGPDGEAAVSLLSGGYPNRDTAANLDNLYASP